MLKKKTTSSPNGNGAARLPKASDFTLPKTLTAKQKKFIETGRAVMDALQKARENGQKVEK